MKRFVGTMLCLILLISLTIVPASANSAQTVWSGVSSTGAIITDGDCPVVVEHELLTFDLQEFPESYYRDEEGFLDYSAAVTAEYTFYNPADYTVAATLLFPFGCDPDYGYGRIDTEKYGVAVNGEGIETVLRHSWSPYSGQFELKKDMALLHDGFRADEFYSPDLTVTRYTYTVSGVDRTEYPAADVALEWAGQDGSKLYFPGHSCFHTLDGGAARIGTSAREGTVELYLLGEPLREPVRWTFYQNGGLEDGEEITGTVTLSGTETLTFGELALSDRNGDCGVSETDWYNAVLAAFLEYESHYAPDLGLVGIETGNLDVTGHLMCWYEYEITLEPGERIVNTVTAPMYPAINAQYEPPVYTYTYLLSPAQTWTQFGSLEIVVNTPYHMTECGVEGFEETDTGYVLTLDGLPEGELEFALCTEENPKKDVNYGYLKFYLVPIVIVVLTVAAAAVSIVKRVHRNKQK